jgi:hypothetical protein
VFHGGVILKGGVKVFWETGKYGYKGDMGKGNIELL